MPEQAPVILVLDDEPMVTTTIKNYLSLAGGYEAVVFSHPAEALEYLKTHPVDAIISDQIMPGMNGLEFFTQVKEVQPEAIRVLLTGYAEKEDAIRAINQIGLFQFIEKPWSNEQLLLAVRNGLERKRLYLSLQKRIGELQIAADEIDRLKNGLVELYLERTVKPAEEGTAAGAGAAHARHELRKIVGTEMQSRARKFMYAFAAVSVLLVVTVSYIVYRSFFAIGKEAVRLQVQLSEIKSKQLNAAEIERLRVSLAAAAAHQVEPSEHVIAQYQGSVCLIQGSYIFRDKDSGNVLRLAAPGPESPPRLVSSGTADVTVEGNGPPLENSYSGTGFLVSADGKILTNRHVGEPWWGDAQAEKIIAAGFRPERGSVVAYFPDRPRAFALKTLKVSGSGDVALLQATPPEDLPEPIPLEGKTPAVGAPIMLIGYPLGLEPILARANQKELDQIPNFLNLSVEQVARELATRNLIRPFITLGHVSNVTEKVLAYDAASTMGSSGGPLFNQEGKVIAIHYAVLPEFTAASLGVPIQHALALMKN